MLFRKKNILLSDTYDKTNFTSQGAQGKKNIKPRDRVMHGNYILRQLDNVWNEADAQRKAMFATIKQKEGTYIEIRGAENHQLIAKSLENVAQGIQLLNLRQETEDSITVQAATVYIPKGKEEYFSKKVLAYLEELTEKGNPKNKDLVESIEIIKLAVISSFWIGEIKDIPVETEVWCEIWLWSEADKEKETAELFYEECNGLEIQHKDRIIVFPEKVVVLCKVNYNKLQILINICSKISEIRRAPETADFYVHMNGYEAREWIEDLKNRIEIDEIKSFVCILDTGINKGHPLLEDIISDEMIQSVDNKWHSNDKEGHGTSMAGVCEYFDLEPLLSGEESIVLDHRLESIKILPDNGTSNDAELYGSITMDATSLADLSNPNARRVYCMAVTADKYVTKDGSPSSWSAVLDNIIAGTEDDRKKLFVVSAGNVTSKELEEVTQYTDANILHPVEDPGQSWNALTIGAYASRIEINDSTFKGWNPVADVNELCPFSSTSLSWDSKWPIKPEILLDGGNAVTDGTHIDICDEVSILTTYMQPLVRPFTTINATSAATAQASYIAAKLMAEYPELWEETIRGLMVHSAEWADKMKVQFCTDDKKTTGRSQLLRTCGYGIASLDRAIMSMNNSVNMIMQAEIQPYCKEGGDYKTNEMHIHKLPWPKDMLRELENTPVSMKVTLSYYIEAAPDQKGWNNKYRYSSCGLRFEVNNKNESKDDLLKRINIAVRGEDRKDKGNGTSGSDRWYLGRDNRDVGSIHSDTWNGSAIDLADSDYIAVYPVIGWWRERHNLGMYDKKVRYALIVTLSTPIENIDFYTTIETIINTEIKTEVKITV